MRTFVVRCIGSAAVACGMITAMAGADDARVPRPASTPPSDAAGLAPATLLETVANSPDEGTLIHVFPAEIHLATTRDRQSITAQLTTPKGVTHDITKSAAFQVADPAIAQWQDGYLLPLADGMTKLTVAFGRFSQEIPVTVQRASERPPLSFRLDVMPILMRTGCNSGSCHGAARGKDGFRLSLFGFDPAGDHHRLTREISGRRINLAVPQESLLIEKGLGKVTHTGGQRFRDTDEYYQTLIDWLSSGAANDASEPAKVDRVELYPPRAVLEGTEATQQLVVRAKYSDGSDRDVTSLALFLSNNDNTAQVSPAGVITSASPGEAFVMARFDTHTVGIPVIVTSDLSSFAWQSVPEFNYIDTLVHEKLRTLRMQPAELCSDEVFLRRATIDICGMLPTADEYHRFVNDTDPAKRQRLVEDLLQRKEFAELWVMKWSELLQIRSSQQVSYKSTLLYYTWLQTRIANNMPINQLVKELLSASGGTFASPATNYFQNETDTLKVAENVAQVFLGMRIQCAQCHNHPFDRWTMDDYYGFAAFFSQISRKAGEDPRETIVCNSGSGEMNHPVDGRVMPPKPLGDAIPEIGGRDRRQVLADWLAAPENPYFARNLANIVWAHFFGKGIIEPVDDVRVSNPPTNAALLEELARRFVSYDYDFKQLVRDICSSRTYQLSTVTNESNARDTRNFAHAELRRLRAEVLLDAISRATDTKDKFVGLPLGARATEIADGNTSTYFLTTFGRATRTTVCSCEVKMEPNLSQALHFLNGDTIQAKIAQGGLVARLLAAGKLPREIVDEMYVRTLCRKATEQEWRELESVLASSEAQQTVLEDIFWALLNSQEFLFNH